MVRGIGRAAGGRFATLDAIRGICAIIVMTMHTRVLTGYDPFPGGYMVVDIFFMMSGFVLGHAYDTRLQQGGYLRTFLLRRYARLLPMWAIGICFGAIWPLYQYWKAGHLLVWGVAVIAQIAFIPTVWEAFARPSSYLFPFNTAGWSLFFEMVANLAYGAFARYLTRRVLFALVALAWIGLVWAAFDHGGSGGGSQWFLVPNGLARVTFSFFAGLLIYKLPRPRDGGWAARALFLAGLLLMTILCFVRLSDSPSLHALQDLATVSMFFPLLMWSALRVELRQPALAEVLGMISYPLYAIHLPVIVMVQIVHSYFHHWRFVPLPTLDNLALLCGTVLIAYLLGRFVDPPAQRWAAGLIHQRPVGVPQVVTANDGVKE